MKTPSKERGCDGKIRIGRETRRAEADKMSKKHGKRFGVYSCHHCGFSHLTSKIDERERYAQLLYVTD